jgi:hypothetical protein
MKRKDIRPFDLLKGMKFVDGGDYMFFETNIQDNSGGVKNPVSTLRHLRGYTLLRFGEEDSGRGLPERESRFGEPARSSTLPFFPGHAAAKNAINPSTCRFHLPIRR